MTKLRPPNNIEKLREARDWTYARLAAEIISTSTRETVDNSTLSKLEKRQRSLTLEWMIDIARALNVEIYELYEGADKQKGFSEESAIWTPPDDHLLQGKDSKRICFLEIKENILDEIGILKGDIIEFDMSPKAVKEVETGNVVLVQIYDKKILTKAKTVIRQYVWPSLLITNSAFINQPVINMRASNAHIKAVMESSHRMKSQN